MDHGGIRQEYNYFWVYSAAHFTTGLLNVQDCRIFDRIADRQDILTAVQHKMTQISVSSDAGGVYHLTHHAQQTVENHRH
jgi:hypothetical protein